MSERPELRLPSSDWCRDGLHASCSGGPGRGNDCGCECHTALRFDHPDADGTYPNRALPDRKDDERRCTTCGRVHGKDGWNPRHIATYRQDLCPACMSERSSHCKHPFHDKGRKDDLPPSKVTLNDLLMFEAGQLDERARIVAIVRREAAKFGHEPDLIQRATVGGMLRGLVAAIEKGAPHA